MGFENFFQLVEDVFVYCDQEEIKLFVGIARRLRLRRNDVVHEGSLAHPTSLVQCIVTAMEEFSKAHDSQRRRSNFGFDSNEDTNDLDGSK